MKFLFCSSILEENIVNLSSYIILSSISKDNSVLRRLQMENLVNKCDPQLVVPIAILYSINEYLIKTAYWSSRKIEVLYERTLGL